MWGSRIYTQDAFSILDGAWRVINGQRPHVDFYSGLGPVTYLMTAAGVMLASGNAVGLAYGQAIFGCLAGLWGYLLCQRRLRDWATILLCVMVVLMTIVPTTVGDSSTGITPATTYNRCGYGLVALLMIEAAAACRSNRRSDEFCGGASSGLVLGTLLFLKISYFMGAGFLLVGLAPLRPQSRDRWYGIGVGFALTFLAFACYLRFDLAAVYHDLRTVAQTKHVMLGFAFFMRCIVDTVQATTRPGSTLRQFRRQPGRERPSNTARGVARSAASSSLNRAKSLPMSIGVPVVSPTRIWICSSRSTASISSSLWGS
jgi:hypothetical protein